MQRQSDHRSMSSAIDRLKTELAREKRAAATNENKLRHELNLQRGQVSSCW